MVKVFDNPTIALRTKGHYRHCFKYRHYMAVNDPFHGTHSLLRS